jgi:hypothetical protein
MGLRSEVLSWVLTHSVDLWNQVLHSNSLRVVESRDIRISSRGLGKSAIVRKESSGRLTIDKGIKKDRIVR